MMREREKGRTQEQAAASANLKPERERRPPGDALIERFLHVARHDTTVGTDASPAARRRAELRRLRNVALLETLISTGARIGEAVGLNVGDLLDDHDLAEGHVAHLAGRLAEDDAWPEELSQAQRAHPELTDQVYGLRMKIRQAREVTAHSFRHALGTKLLEETGDLAAVQELLGHADPGTTRRYSGLSDEQLRQVHREGLRRS
jgi:site-specific recombinase XerD